MGHIKIVSLLAAILLLGSCNQSATKKTNAVTRSTHSLNNDWMVRMNDTSEWLKVNIPHTPVIEPLVVNDQWQGYLSYKKIISVDDPSKIYQIEFEGVMHEASVYLNDQFLTKHQGGYLPFVVDITDQLVFDKDNTLLVVVNNEDNATIPPGKSLSGLDFNFYGGIYRAVNLKKLDKVHITNPIEAKVPAGGGTLIHFDEVSEKAAKGFLQVHIANKNEAAKNVSIKAELKAKSGQVLTFNSEPSSIAPNSHQTITLDLTIQNPALWSTENAHLYELSTSLMVENQIVQTEVEKIGVRSIELTQKEFFLNGEKQYFRGTNRHQEYPYVGYAISKNANRRDAIKIKQAGFDFVRLSHYPQDVSFLEACDELGILVMNAIPGWQYYSDDPEFLKNSYQDIRDMVRRDRNHPSVVFWEVSLNESPMTDAYMVEANKILKEELPFEDTYSAGWIDHDAFDLYIPARQHGRAPDYWIKYRTDNRPLFIAEYGDWEYYAHNAGFNQAAYEGLKEEERTSRQLRAHGEKRLLQQALNFQEAANSNRKGPNTIGDANWLMFDYNRGYANDLEASGISDIFRIPKFAYYFYQSQRPPFDTLNLENAIGPMVKIATNWTEDSPANITVYSNCEEVGLYLNGKLIERKLATRNSYNDQLDFPTFQFDLKKFQKGELKAIGYINDQQMAQDLVATPGSANKIMLEVDLSNTPISTTEDDLVFVYAKIVDANGNLIPDSDALVTFTTNGGELIGTNPVKSEAGIATILLKTSPLNKKKYTITSKTADLVSNTLNF
ncbi:MAG: glycoside hydrolase family 2 TIM barrel-domain containing protein [Cyclobacteriaceae bacterium]